MASEKAQEAPLCNVEALQLSDELVDMLMLLDYEEKFCTKELQPIARTFFVYPAANTAYQFKYFTQIIVWCLRLIKLQADWDEYDDPNTVITNMLVILKDNGVPVSADPRKLKQGHGDSVCLVLHTLFLHGPGTPGSHGCGLLREVLGRTGFEYGVPTYPDEGLADEAEVDSDAEIDSVGEDEMPGDGEEDDLMYQEDEVRKDTGSDDEDRQVLQTNLDPREWLLEVERVASKLKIQMPNDSKEWRTHLQQTRGYKQVIESQFPGAKSQLEKLSANLSQALERIRSKESFINTQFESRALDYRHQQEELNTVQTQYTELHEVVVNLQTELKNVLEELEVIQSDLEERSATVTDTAPIAKMKDAFKKLRHDTRQLEVRIGVVSHTLMQAKLRQRPQDDRKLGLYGGAPNGNDSDRYED